MKPPTKRAITAAVSSVAVLVGGLLTLLWLLVDGTSTQAPTQLELVRIALTILLGTGGLFGLYLAWRRQRSTEIALRQKQQDQADVARAYMLQERTALAGEADAAARRITDLYTKSVEQLGSDKAPVRLGGLYALERLAQDHDDQRQTIVNVLCAYLRMPYALPGDPPAADTDTTLIDTHRERTQEREVRLTAQRILAHHLRPGDDPDNLASTFWADIDLDLTGATLIDCHFSQCIARDAGFRSVTFTGPAWFQGTTFTSFAKFDGATFTKPALFDRATFTSSALFNNVTFTSSAFFTNATFTSHTYFRRTIFAGIVTFEGATFTTAIPSFTDARFDQEVPSDVQRFVLSPEGQPPSISDN